MEVISDNETNKKPNVVRRRLFVKHDRVNSDSNQCVGSMSSQEKRSSGVFSFFKWFKKSDENIDSKNNSLPSSPTLKRNQSLSCGSLLSTATVSSFSFVNPGKYRSHVLQKQIQLAPDTDTYRNRIKQRDKLRELEKDLTLKKKYKLMGSCSTIYRSVENLPTCSRPNPVSRSSSLGRKKRKAPPPPRDSALGDVKNRRDSYGHRRTCSDSTGDFRRLHVKGKRKAPPPPTPSSSINNTLSRSWRKKRPAPSLPFNSEEKTRLLYSLEKLRAHVEQRTNMMNSPIMGTRPTTSVCNDILKLESGVLKANKQNVQVGSASSNIKDRSVTPSSPVSPRPWYKRNSKPNTSEKHKHKDKDEDWLSEGNIQPRKNSASEYDLRSPTPQASSSSSNFLKPLIQNSNSNKRSQISLPETGIKHSLSNTSCNSNSSNHSSKFHFFSKASDENKRRSQISMLANISALDREAAEIIEKEQKRQKQILELENSKYYTDAQTPNEPDYSEINENDAQPRRSSARELISLFNAIGNVTRVTVNTSFFTRDSASNLFSRSDKKFNVNCEPSPPSKKTEKFKKIENFDELEHLSESPQAKRANQIENRSKLRLGFGEPFRPLSRDQDGDEDEGVVIEEIVDDDNNTPKTNRSEANRIKYHITQSPSISTIVELSEHSSVTTPASTLNSPSEVSSIVSTPGTPQNSNAPNILNSRKEAQILQYVWACPQCTLENLKWKFVCDACNFFRPFSIEMKPKTDNSSNKPSITNKSETSIFAMESSNTNSVDKTLKNGVGFCTPGTSNNVINNGNRKAPYYMSDVLKSPDKSIIIADYLKNKTTTSILLNETNDGSSIVQQKENATGNVNIQIAKVDELRKARVAFFDKTNAVNNPIEQNISENKTAGFCQINKQIYSKDDLLKMKEILKEMKHSLPSSSNEFKNTNIENQNNNNSVTKNNDTTHYSVSPMRDHSVENDHEIKPFVKFDKKANQESILTVNGTSDHQHEDIKLEQKRKEMTSVARDYHKQKENTPKLTKIITNTPIETDINGRKETNITNTAKICNGIETSMQTKIQNINIDSTNPGQSSKLSLQIETPSKIMNNNEKMIQINDKHKKEISEKISIGLTSTSTKIINMKENGEQKSKIILIKENNSQTQNHCEISGTNIKINKNQEKNILVNGVKKTIQIQTNETESKEDNEYDENSLDRIKMEDEKKSELYLIKSQTILEDILVKKPINKVSISCQTNSTVIKKSEIESNNINRDAYNVSVPIVHEKYTIENNGKISKSLTKKNEILGINTFNLMKSKDFANIEAVKTGRQLLPNGIPNHTYANTDDDSLSSSTCTSSTNCTSQVSPALSPEQRNSNLIRSKCFADFKARFVSSNNNVNTVAVNRLLKRLEAAIANGEHHKAASLAKELARLKISCSVTRQQYDEVPQTTKHILVNMYVEDKVSHQGPIPLSIVPTMSVAQLKKKLEIEYEIPCKIQRWILGKNLGTNENATLEQMGVIKNGTPVFLYLVASESHPVPKSNNPSELPGPSAAVSPDVQTASTSFGTFNSAESSRASSLEPDIPNQGDISPDVSTSPDMPTSPVIPPNSTLAIGWKCQSCTLMNSPTRPGCAACNTRPEDYQMPENYVVSPNEFNRLQMEEQIEKEVAAQKVANYEMLVQLEHSDLVISSDRFECPVCLAECIPNNGAILRECLHSFCKQCLIHTIQYNSEAVVKCPYRDTNYACDSTLQDREIKALVSSDLYEQHLAKSIAHAEAQIRNAFHCKTPDCKGWCIFEDNVNEFLCPVCTHTNCLTCQAIHEGLNCKQYQDHMKEDSESNIEAKRTHDMLDEMVERGEAMVCPQCHVVLMKKWGCDWLRCSMCKTEICWVTRGPRWGPNGKGDTSAGCKCGIHGVKCHPKCNYCH